MVEQYGVGIHNHYCLIARKVRFQIEEVDRVFIRSNNPYCHKHLESALGGLHEGWIVIKVCDVEVAAA